MRTEKANTEVKDIKQRDVLDVILTVAFVTTSGLFKRCPNNKDVEDIISFKNLCDNKSIQDLLSTLNVKFGDYITQKELVKN